MKIEFKNGSIVETVENTSVQGNVRGKRANHIVYQNFNLKWYQKIYISIYVRVIGLFTRVGYVKRH